MRDILPEESRIQFFFVMKSSAICEAERNKGDAEVNDRYSGGNMSDH